MNLSEVANGTTSIQRMEEYIECDDFEAEFETPEAKSSWPRTGQIQVKNVNVRYRKDLPLVLKNISCDIRSGERVGIVGRTGCGKSTFLLTLNRILEMDKGVIDKNEILIDGQNVQKIGLHHLRKNITTIPQDPWLMEGTVKMQVDPFGKHSDQEIINVVNLVGLNESIPTPILNYQVEASGKNLSLGQRQLISLCRAILSNPKILLMDEATSNIDQKTDQKIQQILKNQFKYTTIITIAHRLDTVMDYDKIIVLEKGSVAEKGTVQELLSLKKGIFKGMVEESNNKSK